MSDDDWCVERSGLGEPETAGGPGPPPDGDDDRPVDVAYDRSAFPPLATAPAFGDPGHQRSVVASAGPLTPGVPDTIVDFFTAEPFEFRAVSTRGLSHRHLGTPRQDSFAAAVSDDWVAFAVADGVSQGEMSHIAAETAARAAVRLAVAAAPDIDWGTLADRVSLRIADEAVYRRVVPERHDGEEVGTFLRTVRSAMASTLVVAVVCRRPTRDGAHDGEVAVVAGDSGAYAVVDRLLVPAVGGKDADAAIAYTSVRPLPGPSLPEVVPVSIGQGGALLLVSDGIGDPVGDAGNDLGAILGESWSTPPTADALVCEVNFLRRSYDDDRTLAGVWLLPEQDRSEVQPARAQASPGETEAAEQ
jgi:serine/threonine protein phosphatase PrpC